MNNGKQKVIYTVSNKKLLSVSNTGTITTKYPGSTKITAKAGKSISSITVNIIPKVTDIILKTNTIYINQPVNLKPFVIYEPINATSPTVSYKIADPSIAKVDQTGKITGLTEGKTKLTLIAGLKTNVFDIQVIYGDIFWNRTLEDYADSNTVTSWAQNNSMFSINRNVYDARNGKLIKSFDSGDIDFIKDGLAKITVYGTIELFNQRLQQIDELTFDSDPYPTSSPRVGKYSRRYTSDGKVVFNEYYKTLMFNLNNSEVDQVYKIDDYGFGQSGSGILELTPDESKVAIARENNIYLFKKETGVLVDTYSVDSDINGLSFSPDGKKMTVLYSNFGENNTTVDVINLETSLIDYTLSDHVAKVTDIVYSPNGKYLATSSIDGVINIYDTTNYTIVKSLITPYNKEKIKLKEGVNGVWRISFSPDGQKLLSLYENEIVLWNTKELQ
jgi:WD40 repeat protein